MLNSIPTDERAELIRILNELYAAKLITSTGGNISLRVSGEPNVLWIMPSQIFKGDLRPDQLVKIDLDGNPLDSQAPVPSSERFVHCSILRRRPELNAVIHTHAPYSLIMALTETPFLPVTPSAAFITDIARVPFVMPGTRALGEIVAHAMGKGKAVLMQNHGLVVAAASLRSAADITHLIEETAHAIITCLQVGIWPPVLPPSAVEKFQSYGELKA